MCIFDVGGKWPCGGPLCKLNEPADWKLAGPKILKITHYTLKIKLQSIKYFIKFKSKQYKCTIHFTHPGGYCILFGCWFWCILLSSGIWGCCGIPWLVGGIPPARENCGGGRLWECGIFWWKGGRSWGGWCDGRVPDVLKWGGHTATVWCIGIFGGSEPLYIWNIYNNVERLQRVHYTRRS